MGMKVQKQSNRPAGRRPRRRRAAAVVEMAVVTPLLLTLLFGVIEFGWIFMVMETMTNATREACRVAVLQGTTDDEIETRFQEAVEPTGLDPADVTLEIVHATAEDPVVTIRARVLYDDVTLLGFLPTAPTKTIGSECSMRKEGL